MPMSQSLKISEVLQHLDIFIRFWSIYFPVFGKDQRIYMCTWDPWIRMQTAVHVRICAAKTAMVL